MYWKMYWKMSIDLSRPLVPSMGQHDPIDGLTVYYEIERAASEQGMAVPEPGLTEEIAELEEICDRNSFATDDPLGIGGLLFDAFRLAKIIDSNKPAREDKDIEYRLRLLETLLSDTAAGLRDFAGRFIGTPLSYRLAFRELGLAIALHGIPAVYETVERNDSFAPRRKALVSLLEEIESYAFLTGEIESTWIKPDNRSTVLWLEHKNINSVMLATSLVPGGFLRV